MTRLAELTTLHVGGPAREIIFAKSETQLIAAVQSADNAGTPLLILGGGSNVLINDAGFDGIVLVVQTEGNSYEIDACSGGMLQVAAGVNWDDFVAFTLEKNLANLESLSGIPGTVGAAPIQNIGAYGHEVGEVIARVRAYDREKKEVHTFTASECGFEYRSSIFKTSADRYVILDVTFQLRRGESSLPIAYSQSEQNWSAGSFFTNPIVAPEVAAALPASAPQFVQPDGRVKLSAAWLIQNSGIEKGLRHGGAQVSEKHVLALMNSGSATAAEIAELAQLITEKVKTHFGIELTPEVRFI